ncbi:MAG: DUF1579 family protein [Pseudomonadota bacterium]
MRFTRHIHTTILLFTALTGVAPAVAQEPPAPPSKPATENDGLKVLLGNWTCEGTANLGPGKSVKIKATAKTKNELGGFWQSFVYTEKKTKDYPMALTAIGTWGWESQSKKFVRAEFQSTGGYVTGTSTGWTGDTMVWNLDISNFIGKFTATHTFTKKGDKEFVHKLEAKLPGSPGPMTLFEATCKK